MQQKALAAAYGLLCLLALTQVQRIQSLGIDPIVDYVFPIWPTINCFNPARSDNSQVDPSTSFTNYLTAVQNKAKQFTQSGLFFTAQCKASLILHGTIECYYVFDRTSYRTGLNTLKNTQPYSGISLNFCAIQLDGGPVKTSTICFDNSGIDPNHPYVIAKVETAGPQYNIFQTLFGASVHDANVSPPQDYTISFTCYFV
ncbi:g10813 [Coccomyxa elongata]